MGWTKEKEELLMKLVTESPELKYSVISQRVGVTRASAIGKAYRLKLAKQPVARPKSTKVKSKDKKPDGKPRFGTIGGMGLDRSGSKPVEPYVPPAEEMIIPENERKYIQTLTECCCRWPIGDPQLADFHFCGTDKVPGMPYCEFHARRAFKSSEPRERKKAREEQAA